MAWCYSETNYPHTRQEAFEAAMSVREEDIDYSDIPPLEIKDGMVISRAGDKFIKVGERNLKALNKIIREYNEMKNSKE